MKITIKGFISPKEAESFYDCADRYAINQELNKFAISDGVSKSFFPKVWAESLVENWVEKKWESDECYIEYCQRDWLQKVTEIVNKPETKWFTRNAFNRKEAGLATFVGLQFYEKSKKWYWKANALGDSFLFFVPSNLKDFQTDVIKLSSKSEPIEFDNFPDYVSSRSTIKHKGIPKKTESEPLIAGTFFLMTDALAEWFINEQKNAIHKTEVWQSQLDFERFIAEERLSKLGNDDSAILIIKVEDNKKDNITYKLESVSDINDLIDKQRVELEEIANQKKQEEQEIEASSKEVTENETSEEEIKEESSENGEKPDKNLIQKCVETGKKGIETISNMVKGKKEAVSEIDNSKEQLEKADNETAPEVNDVTNTNEESVKDENKEVSVNQLVPSENKKTSQNDENETKPDNSTIENQTKVSEEKVIDNKSTDSKNQTQKKDSKNITDKF